MSEIINQLIKDLEDFGIRLDKRLGDYIYVKKTLKEAFLAGEIEGLKKSIKVQEAICPQ